MAPGLFTGITQLSHFLHTEGGSYRGKTDSHIGFEVHTAVVLGYIMYSIESQPKFHRNISPPSSGTERISDARTRPKSDCRLCKKSDQ
jgi:hypothetical protein